MTNDWTEEAIRLWQSKGIELNTGGSSETIKDAELLLQFIFPDSFKELYLKVNGFNNWDWTPNMISIWPVDRIVEEYNSNNDKDFIGFSDYLINSHQIGFFRDKPGIYKDYNKLELIANTFEEAIRLINLDSELIY